MTFCVSKNEMENIFAARIINTAPTLQIWYTELDGLRIALYYDINKLG